MTDHDSPRLAGCSWVAGTTAATAALYLTLLGWHAQMARSPDRTECSGPYAAWQVVILALALVVVVGVAAWHRHPWSAAISCVVCLTVLWSVDAATVDDPCQVGANLWPIGAFLLFVGSAAGLGMVAAAAGYGGSSLRRGPGSSSLQ